MCAYMYFSETLVESFCSQRDGERLFYPLIPGCYSPQDPEVVMTCEDEHDHCPITCELSMILLYLNSLNVHYLFLLLFLLHTVTLVHPSFPIKHKMILSSFIPLISVMLWQIAVILFRLASAEGVHGPGGQRGRVVHGPGWSDDPWFTGVNHVVHGLIRWSKVQGIRWPMV